MKDQNNIIPQKPIPNKYIILSVCDCIQDTHTIKKDLIKLLSKSLYDNNVAKEQQL